MKEIESLCRIVNRNGCDPLMMPYNFSLATKFENFILEHAPSSGE